MRICEHCGAEIPDGEFVCPSCGAEVNLVPDYETMESRVRENQMRQEEENARRAEAVRLAKEEELRKKKKRNRIILVVVIAAACAVIGVLAYRFWVRNQQNHSFDYQYNQAVEAFQNKDYNDALNYVTNALEINDHSAKARLLLGEIYEATDNPEKAAEEYETLISQHPDYKKAFEHIIPIYVELKDYEALQNVFEECQNDEILEEYADYITYKPEISLKSGTYASAQSVEITSEDTGEIHYTTDGSDPDETSAVYSEPIRLSSGSVTLKAIYISKKNIPSDIVEAKYVFNIPKPPTPTITPDSGTYSSTEVTKITVEVPDGYTAYYSFDEPATKNSKKYTGPVSMKTGSHVFYAVLVDADGNEGDVASATYNYSKVTPTPTPTVTSQNANAVQTPAATTPTATPEATETPTATPTPTATSGADGSDEE
ncbi:MAG: chitobiase/beta-hexosaminidase C-terminal domain-containing protein [Bilifractor sp.]|jgi:tetratricopeptide (TPR) repeat protein